MAQSLGTRLPDLERELLRSRPKRLPPVADAKRSWLAYRLLAGFVAYRNLLAEAGSNYKMAKNDVPTVNLSMAQDKTSGIANVCRHSTRGCRAGCVAFNGNGLRPSVLRGRALRVRFALSDPASFLSLLLHEAGLAARKGRRLRLNTFSDIAWERVLPELGEIPGLSVYDYGKDWKRSSLDWYRLTFSVSERTSLDDVRHKLAVGERVAVVYPHYERAEMPATWLGYPVVDGDINDDRWATPPGTVVALFAKGRLRKDATGFVRSLIIPVPPNPGL